MRVDVCTSDDTEAIAALLSALAEAGAVDERVGSPEEPDPFFGPGLYRFRFGGQMLTVYVDAWAVDLEGPDDLVHRVMAILSGSIYESC